MSLLSEQLAALDLNVSTAEIGDIVGRIDEEMAKLSELRAVFAADLITALDPGDGREFVAGFPTVNITLKPKSVSWKYDNQGVLKRVIAIVSDKIGVDRETGEIPPPAAVAEFTVRTMAALTGAATPSFSAWRSTELEALGLSVNDLREKKPTDYKVVVTPVRDT